ncbi:7-cyano-7-deazaguanine synthase QueC [bacterium]|nr:7-cyano-7-deazaguanine synthase QueC [bacterium]
MTKKAIILVSGGMDSLVTIAIAKQENAELYFLHANYGQKTQTKEQECFDNLVQYYHPKDTLTVDLTYLKQIGGTSLIDINQEIKDHNLNDSKSVPDTYVPFRNGNLIVIATSWAEVIGAQSIYIGAVEEDSSGYPDCRETFYQALNKAIDIGTKDETKIQIKTPIIHKTKAEIINIGKKLNAPFQFSWSCYRNNDYACGSCDSCFLRLKAFKKAGMKDPIPYQNDNH